MSFRQNAKPPFRFDRNEGRPVRHGRPSRPRRPCCLIGETLEERLVLSGQSDFFPQTYFPSGELAAVLTGIGIMTDSVEVTPAPPGTYPPQTASDWQGLENEVVSLGFKSGVTVADLSNLDSDLAAIGNDWSSINSQGLWPVVSELASAVAGGTSTTQAQTDWSALFAGSGVAQSVVDQTLSDLVQTIQDSHVTTTDLAAVAGDETAFINDTEPGDGIDNQQQFTGEGLYYQGYGYMISPPAFGGMIGLTLSSIGVMTDQYPSSILQLEGVGSQFENDEQALQNEFATVAEKSGLTVGDLNNLNSDDQTIMPPLLNQPVYSSMVMNDSDLQSSIDELANAVARGASTTQAQADFDAAFASGAPSTEIDKTFGDLVQAIEDSHVTTADLSAVASDTLALASAATPPVTASNWVGGGIIPSAPVTQPAAATLPVSVTQPVSPTVQAVTPGSPFGFTLSVKPISAVGKAASGDTVTLALADGPGGDTLTVSTKDGVSTYSSLTLQKHGRFYRLVNDAVSPVKASASRARLVKARPMLIERALLTGTGKHKHMIGVEVAFKPSLARSLAKEIAAKSADQPVNVRLGSGSSGSGAGMNFAGVARFAAGGKIVVVAKT